MILIVAALAVAGITAFLVSLLIDRNEEDQEASTSDVETIEVLVADRALPAGLIITGEHFVWRSWPKSSSNESFIVRSKETKIENYIGSAVKSLFNAGEPILESKLIKPGTPGFLPGALKPGMRAFTLRVSPITSTASFVLPGMHVDLVLTLKGGSGFKPFISETIMQNVRILALDSRVSDGGKAASRSKTITVEVTPKNVERLAIATRVGQIRLVVRSLARDPKEEKLDPFTSTWEISEWTRARAHGNPVIMVAKTDLPRGTLIRDVDYEWRVFPTDTRMDGQIQRRPNSDAAFNGGLVLKDMKAGQAILIDDIMRKDQQGFMTQALQPGMRAVNVGGATQFVSPGDRIDVLMTQIVRALPNQFNVPARRVTETIFSNVRVISINSPGSLTLEFTANQAQKMLVARTMGFFTFLVRRRDDNVIGPAYATDLESSKAYADSYTRDPVSSLVKHSRDLDRQGQGQSRVRIYGANVPNIVGYASGRGPKGRVITSESDKNEPVVVVVPEQSKSE